MRRNAVFGALIVALPLSFAPAPVAAQDRRIDAQTAKEMLAAQARGDGWWVASNAEHRARNDRLPDYYAMRHELVPGGYASVGCMWGGRDGETVGPFWSFLSAWDPVEEALLVYQVNRGGAVAMGHATPTGGPDHEEEGVQAVHPPGGEPTRIRHLSSLSHPDTLVTRSFDWQEGEWVPRRHDVWVWTDAEGREPPVC